MWNSPGRFRIRVAGRAKGSGGICQTAMRRGRDPAGRLLELDRPVGVIEEGLPTLILPVRELHAQRRTGAGLDRLADQSHAGLPWGAASLADVALQAGADDVLPGRLTAAAPRQDVIEAQLAGGEPLAAILA